MNEDVYYELRRALSERSWAKIDELLRKFERGEDDRRYDPTKKDKK